MISDLYLSGPTSNNVRATNTCSLAAGWRVLWKVVTTTLFSSYLNQFCRKDELLLSQIDLSPRSKFLTSFLPRKLDTATLDEEETSCVTTALWNQWHGNEWRRANIYGEGALHRLTFWIPIKFWNKIGIILEFGGLNWMIKLWWIEVKFPLV